MKRILYIIIAIWLTSILTLDAQVDTIITLSGELGGSGGDFEFVKESGDIVRFPRLTYAGEILYYPPLVTTDSVPEATVSGTSATVYANVVFNGWYETVTGQGFQICPALDFSTGVQTVSVTPDNDYAFCEMPCNHNSYHYTFTGLSPGTTYYVRSYATNSSGTSYGSVVTVTTASYLPTVTTNVDGNNVTATLAIITSNVTSDGGSAVTARGVCWGTVAGPTLSGSHTEDGAGTGSFSSTLTGLTPNTTYYVRPYATNGVGTNYGNEITFTTPCWVVTVSITGETNICEGESTTLTASGASEYEWRTDATTTIGTGATLTVNTSGTYYVIGTDSYGCEGSASKTVTVHVPQHGSETKNVCESDLPYTWHGVVCSAAGTYTYSHSDVNGCTQVDTLRLTVDYGTHNVVTETACESFTWHGTTYTTSGTYTYEYDNADDCESADTLHLTVYYGTHNVVTETACESFTWHGTTYTTSGTYTYAYNNNDGCASVDTLHLTITSCVTSPTPCAVPTTHPAQTGSAYQGNGYQGANYGLETVNTDGKINSVTDYDGNEYPVVQIGSQCWLAENMRCTHSPKTGHRIVGSPMISYGSKLASWYSGNVTMNGNAVTLDSATCVAHHFGLLYNWCAAMDTANPVNYREVATSTSNNNNSWSYVPVGRQQGVCPMGWHVPTDAEWSIMEGVVNGSDISSSINYRGSNGGMLTGGDDWNSSTVSGAAGDYANTLRNSSGFSTVPAGRFYNLTFSLAGSHTNFWSSSEYGSDIQWAWNRFLNYNYAGMGRHYDASKACGFSVRCLRDETNSTTQDPTVTTSPASDVTETTATLNGTVDNPDNVTITSKGFEWKATEGGSYVAVNATGEAMTYNLTGLTPNTGYTYKAFITYGGNTVYGNEVTFTTPAASVDGQPCLGSETVIDIDNNTYNTVQIGTQCWMAQNLRTTRYADGTSIPYSNTSYSSTVNPYYYTYSVYSVTTSGCYYNWSAVMHGTGSTNSVPSGVQGVCPTGWHVPSDAEWTVLTDYMSTQSDYSCNDINTNIAKALAATSGWNSSSTACAVGNGQGTNTSGFTAVPVGYFNGSSFSSVSQRACYWSSTQYEGSSTTTSARYRYLSYSSAKVNRDSYSKSYGFPVRCLRDESGSTAQVTVTTIPATDVTESSAILHGSMTCPDGVTITERGFELKSADVDTYTQVLVTGTGNSFTASVTNLPAFTEHTYRAYITYDGETMYGGEMMFTTEMTDAPAGDAQPCPGTPTVTDIDENVYNTVQIGTQCWMAQNLRTTRYADGTSIPYSNTSNSSTINPYYYTYSIYDITTSGCYYNWSAVMHGTGSTNSVPSGVQGVCPTGWHVPSDAEWTVLTDYLGTQNGYRCNNINTNVAKALAATSGWNNNTTSCVVGNGQGNNTSGFTAAPVGYFNGSSFSSVSQRACYWSSTQYEGSSTTTSARYRYLSYSSAKVNRDSYSKSYGFPVRCLRDESGSTAQVTVTTIPATDVTESSAILHGSMTCLDGVTITERGFELKSADVDTYTQVLVTGTGNSFTASVTNLPAFTEHTYRAYIIYDGGTMYGGEMTFTTEMTDAPAGDAQPCSGTPTVTDIDENVYTTVQIGTQCWMAQNLRTTRYADGTSIPYSNTSNSSTVNPYYYTYYVYDITTSGCYYNWSAVMHGTGSTDSVPSGVQGVCPTGWHVPSDAEWTVLTDYLGTQNGYRCNNINTNIAKALAATSGWNNNTTACVVGNGQGNNTSGFSAAPVGYFNGSSFSSVSQRACFWSSTQYEGSSTTTSARYRYLSYSSAKVNRDSYSKSYGFPVRCLRDETGSTAQDPTVTTSPASNVTETTATLNGAVDNPDNVTITSKGFEWKTTEGGSYVAVNATGEAMTYNLAGLTPNTGYTYKAFITYGGNTVYGNEVTFTTPEHTTFTCGTSTVTDYEGNVYHTVSIGNQCWTKENMRCTISPKGHLTPGGDNSSNHIAYYYDITTSPIPLEERGYLYNWAGAMDTTATTEITESFNRRRGICPEGWHVPSDREWDLLVVYLSGQSQYWCGNNSNYVIKALASKDYWNSSTIACAVGNDTASNNATGFSALPVGCRETSFGYIGSDADFHSSTSSSGNNAYRWSLLANKTVMDRIATYKSHGRSVRCVSDDSETPTAIYMTPTGNETLTTCNAVIYDDGGPMNNYGSYCNSTMVIYPENANQGVAITGTCDLNEDMYYQSHLYFYDGENTNAPLVAEFTHDADIAVAVSGPMTIRFTSSAYTAPGFVLNVSCTSCPPPANVQVSEVGGNTATVSWKGNADQYTVYLSGDATGSYTTADTFYTINGLDANSDYSVQVRSSCGEESSLLTPAIAFKTSCAAVTVTVDDPWTEDFESYTGSGEQPFHCWDRPVVDVSQGSPFVYCGYSGSCHSGANSAELKGPNNMLALPPFTNDIHELRLSFWATTYMTGYGTLEVGVMSDVTDPSTFEVVGTTPAPAPRGSSGSTGNGSFMGYYDFSNVTASSGRIALRYTSTMSNNSWNLDDFVVELIPGGTSVADPTVTTGTATNITENSATLNGSVTNPDNVAITAQGFEWKTSNVGTYTAVNATGETMSLSLTGLTANTSYTYRAFVTTGGGTSYGDEVTFTTTAAVVYECLPYPCSAPPASQIDDVVHQFDNTLYGTASIAYDNNNEPYISIYKGDTLDVQCGWLYKFQVEAGAIYEWNTDVSHALYESVYVNYPLRTKITLFYDDFQTPVVASQEAVNTDILGCAAAGLAWKANYTGTVGVMVTRGDEELDIEGSYCACNNDPLKLRYDKLKESPTNLYFVWGRYGTSDTVPCDDNVHYIYDSGLNSVLQNASGDYSNNENGYLVLYPENSNAKIKLWGDCKMKDGDTLFIYYGDISLNIQFTPDTVLVGQKQLGSEDSPLLITPTAGQPISFRMQTDWECTWSGVELQAKCCLKPGLPADLIGTMNSDTSFLLSWRSAECNEIVYDWNLYKADDSTLVISGSVVDTFVIVEDLNQNDCYYFTVSALSACSEEYAVDGNGNYVVYSDTFCGFHITHGQPCTVSTTHPAQTGSTYQNNGFNGANHGLETVNADGKITSVTDYDGNEYPVVQIGSQCWLAENMRCTHAPSTGTYIVNNQFTTGTSIAYTYTGKMARWYNNDSATYASKHYGLLYNWNAAVDVYNTSYGELSVNTSSNNAVPQTFTGNRQGICPRGWHVPSDDEWTSLTDYVSSQSSYQCSGNSGNIGKALASIEYWSSYSGECYPGDQSQHANNATGFAALPVGYCGQAFIDDSYQTFFWASYDNSGYASSVANRGLGYDGVGFYRGGNVKYFSCSVRCLRDETAPEPEPSVTSSKPCTIPTTHPAQTAVQGYSASGANHGLETVTSDGKINSVTDYDGNEYPVVQIGSQCWLAENLRTRRYSDGTAITPGGSSTSATTAYYYDYSSSNIPLADRGYLYNWPAVMRNSSSSSVTPSGVQGICPSGWHVPSDAEWTQLTDYVSGQSEYVCGGNTSYIAKALASKTYWNTSSGTCYVGDTPSANNATGFGALPAGYYYGNGYGNFGYYAGFWSAAEASSGNAWYRYLYTNDAYVGRNSSSKYLGYSVRCLRD